MYIYMYCQLCVYTYESSMYANICMHLYGRARSTRCNKLWWFVALHQHRMRICVNNILLHVNTYIYIRSHVYVYIWICKYLLWLWCNKQTLSNIQGRAKPRHWSTNTATHVLTVLQQSHTWRYPEPREASTQIYTLQHTGLMCCNKEQTCTCSEPPETWMWSRETFVAAQ